MRTVPVLIKLIKYKRKKIIIRVMLLRVELGRELAKILKQNIISNLFYKQFWSHIT